MLHYTSDTSDITPTQLQGFFEGWPDAPSPERHLSILRSSARSIVAKDGSHVVGFITAITDGELAAYVPLLEVRREYRRHGIGSELVRRMLQELDGFYMVDLVCDPDLVAFYARLGFRHATAASMRRYNFQSGRPSNLRGAQGSIAANL